MQRIALLAIIFLLGAARLWGDPSYPATGHAATGLVLKVDAAQRSLDVSCDAIPGYMAAMEMPFTVREAKQLTSIKPGMKVKFTVVERGETWYAENIRAATEQNFESEPIEASRLSVLHNVMNPAAARRIVAVGQPVPDFSLVDQTQKQVELSQLEGKVVALSFAYSRCPNPNYCYRLSNNMARVAKRFQDRAGRDLVLLTVVIDPEHDQGAVLSDYAAVWKADPSVWHFLTGPLPQIKDVAGGFGMNFWSDEGLLTHSFHTVIIDRKGRLAANLEGNGFTPQQLGDLVETVMNRPN